MFHIKEIRETFLFVRKPPHHIIKTYKFGYESDNPSFKFLRHRIFNEGNGGTVNETLYTNMHPVLRILAAWICKVRLKYYDTLLCVL